MATKFDITPAELRSSGYRIINIANEWVKEVDSIYAALAELEVSYKGEASSKFSTQLLGYQNDFIAALHALSQYVSFLRSYADEMAKIENNLKEQAHQLPGAQRHGYGIGIYNSYLCGLLLGPYIREFSFMHKLKLPQDLKI